MLGSVSLADDKTSLHLQVEKNEDVAHCPDVGACPSSELTGNDETGTANNLQVETDEAAVSLHVASRLSTQVLCTGFGLAVLMLMGVFACTLHPLASHASAEHSRLLPEIAFNTMPVLGPKGILSAKLPRSSYGRAPAFRRADRVGSRAATFPAMQLRIGSAGGPSSELEIQADPGPISLPRRSVLQGSAVLSVVQLFDKTAKANDGRQAVAAGVEGMVLPIVSAPLQRVAVPGAIGGQYATIQLGIQGQQLPLLIDTGFSADLLLTPGTAKALGATARGVASSVTSYSKGMQSIVRVPGMSFSSGKGLVQTPPLDALVGNFPQAMESATLAGMMGMSNFWESFDVDLDLARGRFRLHRQGDGRRVAIPGGMVAVKALPIARFGIPSFKLFTPNGDRVLGLVDTGSTSTIANPAAAKLLGLKPDASFGDFAGAGFAEVATKELEFEPGNLGLQLDLSSGAVTGIAPDGQADRLGVKAGWRLEGLGNEGFTPARLQSFLKGTSKFIMAFKEETLESVTRLARGVPLRVDRGGWSPPDEAYVFHPDRIGIGDLKDLEEFAGPGKPAVILGLDVLGTRRLMFTDGDKGRRTVFLG